MKVGSFKTFKTKPIKLVPSSYYENIHVTLSHYINTLNHKTTLKNYISISYGKLYFVMK